MSKDLYAKALGLEQSSPEEPAAESQQPKADPGLPPEAIHLWLEGKELKLRFPSSHTITISIERVRDGAPLWPVVLMEILRERERAERHVIATRAAPVQYDIEVIKRFLAARPKPTPIEELSFDDMTFDGD